MRLIFTASAMISEVLLILFISVLLRIKSPLRDSILRILFFAFVAVLSNIVIAVSPAPLPVNIAFSFYFTSIDFITYYLLSFTFIYVNRLKFKEIYNKFWRVVILFDAANLLVSVKTQHMYTMATRKLEDGSTAFLTVQTPLFYFHLAFCYIPIVIALVLLSVSLYRSYSFYRFKYFPLLASVSGIVLLNIAYMLLSLPFDYSVLFYALAAFLLYFFALFYIPRRLMNETLRLATDSMKEGLLLFDADRNCIYVNRAARDMFGIDRESCSFASYPLSLWLNASDPIRPAEFEQTFRMTMQDGPHHFRVDYRHCSDSKAHDLGSFFLFEDVTEDHLLMKNLEEARADASQANIAKSLFLANMSHEIRTPINSILGMNEMILRESSDDHILEYADDIRKSGDTLLSLVGNILDLSKIESGKMEIHPAPYRIHDLIRDCYALVSPRAAQKDLPIRIECAPDIPSVLLGDRDRIRQVLVNLLTNGIKYTQYGQVTLKAAWEPDEHRSGILHIVVSDTGQGISEQDIAKLFQVFQRVNEEQNRGVEGTGLGLAISKQILEMMHGSILVSSEVGKGTDFSIILPQPVEDDTPAGPFLLQDTAASKRSAYKEAFHAPNASVLVVDDIEMNLKLMTALLKKTQIGITTAAGGNEAIEICKKQDFDLILMDHMMPPPDGVEAMERIREAGGHNAQIPIVVLTANAVEGVENTYLAMGFDGYLSKPVLSKDLEAMLQKLLPKEKIQAESYPTE
ncbi:MAG: response regulator [Lachnospiraceae bacterium]|nr:response regulator [Lachnospiraceae bacterium]